MSIDFFDNSVGLYFHIPFCTKKCPYCHFYVLKDKEEDQDLLMEGFANEWKIYRSLLKNLPDNQKVKTIYFGGGTPSLLKPLFIQNILDWIRSDHSLEGAEITIEANPENIDLEKLKSYAQAGINRLSMGVQSLDDQLLNILGRGHTASLPLKIIHQSLEAGITNISIDLMYDLPSQDLNSWHKTLSMVGKWPISHLSLYNLTFEPNTLFYKNKKTLQKQLPKEEDSTQMYLLAVDVLESTGLLQYEISAFARDGLSAKHNQGYWLGRPFIGFGPSAFSYWNHKRYQNVANLGKYCSLLKSQKLPIDFQEELPLESRQRELLAIQLRLNRGVDIEQFQKKWGVLAPEVLATLNRLSLEGFIEIHSSVYFLTQKGRLFYDSVATEII